MLRNTFYGYYFWKVIFLLKVELVGIKINLAYDEYFCEK